MSKPYYTKYLPVEGVIKAGELGFSINNALYTHHEDLPDDYGRPVKLFLCSRKIEKGDRVHQIFGDGSISELLEIGNNPITGRVWLNKNGKISHTAHITTLVKPLAEVSPFALSFLEGGEEFDDGWVMLCSVYWHPKYGYSYEQFWEPGGERRRVMKIKGPCGHFH